MEKLQKNKMFIIIGAVVLVIGLIIILGSKSKAVGYVTIDINNDSIKLSYDSKEMITEKDYKDTNIVKGIDKVLANYKDGTIILIGLEDSEVGKKIEKHFIEEYPGIDRHTLKFIYFEKGYLKNYKGTLSLGKSMLIGKSTLDSSYNNKTITEIIDAAKAKGVDIDKDLYDLDELNGFKTRD